MKTTTKIQPLLVNSDKNSNIIFDEISEKIYFNDSKDATLYHKKLVFVEITPRKFNDNDKIVLKALSGNIIGIYKYDEENKTHDIITECNTFPFNTSEYFRKVLIEQDEIPEYYIKKYIFEYNCDCISNVDAEISDDTVTILDSVKKYSYDEIRTIANSAWNCSQHFKDENDFNEWFKKCDFLMDNKE